MCPNCAFEDHADHKTAVASITEVKVEAYVDTINAKIDEKIDLLIKLKQLGLLIKSGRASAKQFIEFQTKVTEGAIDDTKGLFFNTQEPQEDSINNSCISIKAMYE